MRDSVNPTITVLTPTWNRGTYLQRVWASLDSQTCRSFEWIVGNDGSSDETNDIVHGFASGTNFPIVLVDASVRVGKSRMDNEMIKTARGELIVWCDSDDVLRPNAVETLVREWQSIAEPSRNGYVGISALCESVDGPLGCDNPDGARSDLSLSDLMLQTGSDMVIAARADLLRGTPFEEVDYLIPESSVWYAIGCRKTRFVREVLKTVQYGQPNALSLSGKMQYNRGRAYALGRNYKYVSARMNTLNELMRALHFIRYCVHGDIPMHQAWQIWTGSTVSNIFLWVCLLPGGLVAWYDVCRGLVEKTHLGFEEARKIANIQVKVIV